MRTFVLLLSAISAATGQYSVRHDGDVVHLDDGKTQTTVSVMPSHGNHAFDMRGKGKKVLQFPFASLAEYKAGNGFSGIPFFAPWANWLEESDFFANGK